MADLRAPTPSAAAEQVLPDRRALHAQLARDARRLFAAARARVEAARARLGRETAALRTLSPVARLATQRLRLQAASRALSRALGADQERRRARLARASGRLESLSPLGVLARGYALARRVRDGAILRRAGDVAAGESIRIRLAEGELTARVEDAAGSGARSGRTRAAEDR